MSAPDIMLFRFIGETVENAINAFVGPAASNVAGAIGATALTGATLYLAIMGALVIAGYVSNPFWDVIKTSIKISIIAAVCLNAGNYMTWVVSSVDGIQVGIAGAVNTLGGPTPDSIYQTLDTSLGNAFSLAGECFQHADDSGVTEFGTALGWWLCGACIGFGALGFTLLGGAAIIVSKFALAALFAIGPFFIMCLMWPPTARFFDSWFSQAMNYTFTIIFVMVFLSFGLAAFDRFIDGADVSGDGTNSPLFAALQILGCSGILAYIMVKASDLAAGVAGGVSMAAMTLRQLASPVTAPASTAAAFLNKSSNRLDPKTGHQTQSSRLEHFAMGRTIANPAYQRALFDRAREGWANNTVKGK